MSSPSNQDRNFLEANGQSSRVRTKKRVTSATTKAMKKEKQPQTHWRSEDQQRRYSSKLIEAVAKTNFSSLPSDQRRGRAVREAADRALAAASRGRTLWSRAILTKRRLKVSKKQNKLRNQKVSYPTSGKQSVNGQTLKGKRYFEVVQRKGRVLGRLVPGCKRQPLPVILEETSDYITALEMQIRSMTALAELLSCGSITDGSF